MHRMVYQKQNNIIKQTKKGYKKRHKIVTKIFQKKKNRTWNMEEINTNISVKGKEKLI